MSLIQYMTRAERVQRIGELLSKGVTLMLEREAELKHDTEAAEAKDALGATSLVAAGGPDSCQRTTVAVDDTESAILNYIGRVRRASPRDIQHELGIPKATAYRRLNRLLKEGVIVGTGKTTAIRYRLSNLAPGICPATTIV